MAGDKGGSGRGSGDGHDHAHPGDGGHDHAHPHDHAHDHAHPGDRGRAHEPPPDLAAPHAESHLPPRHGPRLHDHASPRLEQPRGRNEQRAAGEFEPAGVPVSVPAEHKARGPRWARAYVITCSDSRTETTDDGGRYLVASTGSQESNALAATATANGLVLLPDGEGVDAGADVRVMLLDP